MRLAIVFALLFTVTRTNAQVQLALETPEWKGIKNYEVKGRNGILIKQKLSFGDYFTTSVERSWTRGRSSFNGVDKGAGSKFRQMISTEYIERNQTLFFTFEDSSRRKADVHCVNDFRVNDIIVGNSGINLAALFPDIAKSSLHVFYVQIYTSADGAPWHMVVDNQAAQESPKIYATRLAKSRDEFFLLSPYRLVKNNKGKITEMTFGSAGFQIRNRKGEPVAAVCLINKGIVYLKDLPEDERFLLASAAAALLLQEQIGTE
jgi:hypothetical protein